MSILNGVKKRSTMEEEDAELVDIAIGEGKRISKLIRSLQDFNRPSSGVFAIMDIHQSLDAIILLHKNDFAKKRIEVKTYYAPDLPPITAVADQIKQVFFNLLTNAADACQNRGGIITISTVRENSKVTIAIKDSGVGIAPADRDNIFRPFYTTKPEVKGIGLGLSISYGIVKNIRVKSALTACRVRAQRLPLCSPSRVTRPSVFSPLVHPHGKTGIIDKGQALLWLHAVKKVIDALMRPTLDAD